MSQADNLKTTDEIGIWRTDSLTEEERALEKRVQERTEEARRVLTKKTLIHRLLFFVGVLVFWEVLSGPVVDPFFVSAPIKIMKSWLVETIYGNMIFHAEFTLIEALGGYLLGTMGGILCAFILAYFPLLVPDDAAVHRGLLRHPADRDGTAFHHVVRPRIRLEGGCRNADCLLREFHQYLGGDSECEPGSFERSFGHGSQPFSKNVEDSISLGPAVHHGGAAGVGSELHDRGDCRRIHFVEPGRGVHDHRRPKRMGHSGRFRRDFHHFPYGALHERSCEFHGAQISALASPGKR